MGHRTTTVVNASTNGSGPPTTGRSGRAPGSALRRILAVVLVVHGIAHLVGTTDAVTAVNENASVSYVLGQWDIGGTGLLVGLATLWAVVAVGFAAAGVTTWVDAPFWPRALATISAVSLVLCLVALPQAAIGVVINIVLLATVAMVPARRAGWYA